MLVFDHGDQDILGKGGEHVGRGVLSSASIPGCTFRSALRRLQWFGTLSPMSVREWMEAEDLQDIDLDEVVSRLQVGVLHVLKLHEWSTYGVAAACEPATGHATWSATCARQGLWWPRGSR